MLIAAFHKLSPETVRLRFFAPIKELTHETAAGLTQIDYDREMALVLADHDRPGAAELYAVARFSTDPDQERGGVRAHGCVTTSRARGSAPCSCAV